jgi:hypothetical protein
MQFPWYMHAAANVYQHRNKIANTAYAYQSYKTLRMLRGTRNKRTYAMLNTKPTLQNQISALRAKVNSQKPETQHYQVSNNHTSGGTLVTETVNLLPTSSLIASTNFRQNVTGDKWTNIALRMKFNLAAEASMARILCYVPKKTGDRFTPATFATTTIPDPNSFWVISDTYVNHAANNRMSTCVTRNFNLRNMKTIYDSNTTSLERGEIVVCIITEPAVANTLQYTYAYDLIYHND